jgi:hypothetical protein
VLRHSAERKQSDSDCEREGGGPLALQPKLNKKRTEQARASPVARAWRIALYNTKILVVITTPVLLYAQCQRRRNFPNCESRTDYRVLTARPMKEDSHSQVRLWPRQGSSVLERVLFGKTIDIYEANSSDDDSNEDGVASRVCMHWAGWRTRRLRVYSRAPRQ